MRGPEVSEKLKLMADLRSGGIDKDACTFDKQRPRDLRLPTLDEW